MRRRPAAAACGLGVLGAILAIVVLPRGEVPARPPEVRTRETTPRNVGTAIPTPTDIAIDRGTAWIATGIDGTLQRLDTRSGELRGAPIRVGGTPSSIAVDNGIAWTLTESDFRGSVLRRISTRAPRVVRTVSTGPPNIQQLEIRDGSLWALGGPGEARVTRLDLRTGRRIGAPIATSGSVNTVGGGFVWSADRDGGGVQRFSARTGKKVGQEINIAVSAGVSDIAVGRDSVWVASGDVIVRLDVRTGTQIGVPVSVGEFADQIEVGNETVWVAGGTLHRIAVSSGLIVGRPLAFPGRHRLVHCFDGVRRQRCLGGERAREPRLASPPMTDAGLPAVDVGDVVGGYRIEGVIGVGAMGTVFRARQLRLDRVVALKVIATGLADDEGARRRFAREARLAVRVVHPHVVSVLDAGEDRGTLFMAMELVDGVDLATLLATEGPLVAWRAVAIVEQLAAALDHAHDLGLVHRDVKPANVLLVTRGDSDHAYLTDFGLAKALRPSSVSDSVVDDVASGTPDYMAPEVLDGGTVDGRADVYALGGLLFAALTARAPYERDTIQATLAAHRHHAPPSLDAAGADSDANRLQPVIDRAMAKRPGDRHQSARGLADHARLETGAKPSRPATSDGRSGMSGSDDQPRSPSRRRRPLAIRMSPFLPMLVRVTLILGMVGVLADHRFRWWAHHRAHHNRDGEAG